MKLGFVSAILDGWSFEEMIDTARDLGFSCVEAACWPSGKAERRYAGVSHIDVDGLTDEKAAYILGYCKERGVELSSLAFYPNTMDEDLEKRAATFYALYVAGEVGVVKAVINGGWTGAGSLPRGQRRILRCPPRRTSA